MPSSTLSIWSNLDSKSPMVTSSMGGRLGPCKWMLADTLPSTPNTDLNWRARMEDFLRGSELTRGRLRKLLCHVTCYRTVYWTSLQRPQTGCCWCISSLISVGGDCCHDGASCMLLWWLCMVWSWLWASSTCCKAAASCGISASILWWATAGHASSWASLWVCACLTSRKCAIRFGSTILPPACQGTQHRSELQRQMFLPWWWASGLYSTDGLCGGLL